MLSHTTQPTYFSISVCINATMGIIQNTFRLTRLEEKNLLKGLNQWFQVAEGIKNFQLEKEIEDSELLEKIKNEVAGFLSSDVIAYFLAYLKRRCDQLKNTNYPFSDEMNIDQLIIPTLLVAIKIADDDKIWNEDWCNIAMKIADDSSIWSKDWKYIGNDYGVKNIQILNYFEHEHLSALHWTLSVTFQEMKDIFYNYFPSEEAQNYQYVLDSLERVSTVPADFPAEDEDKDEEIIEEVDEETEKKQSPWSDNVDNGYTGSSKGSRRSSPDRPPLDEYPQPPEQSTPEQSTPEQSTCGFFSTNRTCKQPQNSLAFHAVSLEISPPLPFPIFNIALIDAFKNDKTSLMKKAKKPVTDDNNERADLQYCSITEEGFKNVDAIIFVVDPTKIDSINNIEKCAKDIKRSLEKDVVTILVFEHADRANDWKIKKTQDFNTIAKKCGCTMKKDGHYAVIFASNSGFGLNDISETSAELCMQRTQTTRKQKHRLNG